MSFTHVLFVSWWAWKYLLYSICLRRYFLFLHTHECHTLCLVPGLRHSPETQYGSSMTVDCNMTAVTKTYESSLTVVWQEYDISITVSMSCSSWSLPSTVRSFCPSLCLKHYHLPPVLPDLCLVYPPPCDRSCHRHPAAWWRSVTPAWSTWRAAASARSRLYSSCSSRSPAQGDSDLRGHQRNMQSYLKDYDINLESVNSSKDYDND